MKIGIRLEGTLADAETLSPIPDNVAAAQLLAADPDNEVLIISSLAGTSLGLQQLLQWKLEHGLDSCEAWSGFALPEGMDQYYDHNAWELAGAL